jgi:hypothetical protein
MVCYRELLGEADFLLVTLDALRLDTARLAMAAGETPCLQSRLGSWQARHAPGNFTYASHAAILAGFFPTPVHPGRHARPFALAFPGSRSTGQSTAVLEGDSLVAGLRARGYHTICIGGTAFFNPGTPLGSVMPALFDEAHWEPEFGVAERGSSGAQIERACARIEVAPVDRPLLLFLNLSATHPPTRFYVAGASVESVATQRAALAAVDCELSRLFAALEDRDRPGWGFVMSDHGTCFGDDGYTGHRVGHPAVWEVPYGECRWGGAP